MKTVILTLLAILILAPAPVRAWQATPPADPCSGMIAYGDAVIAAASDFGAYLQDERILERDVTTISAPEWTAFAERAESAQAALKAIDAPAGVSAWHQFQIEDFGFQSTFARTAARDGILTAAALVSGGVAAERDARAEDARRDALAACPAFADAYERWDMLDGERNDATPEASPTP